MRAAYGEDEKKKLKHENVKLEDCKSEIQRRR